MPWIWVHEAPAWFIDTPYSQIGMADHASLGEAAVTAKVEAPGVVVRVASGWERTISGDGKGPVVLALRGSGVFVGLATPTGARVVGFGEAGEPRFDVPLPGAPWTALQLGLCDEWLCVYTAGDERRVIRLAKDTGKDMEVSEALAGPRVKDAKWPGTAVETREFGAAWAHGQRSYRVVAEEPGVAVERRAGATVSWRTALPDAPSHRANALVLDVGEVAVVVMHSPISSGVTVFVLVSATGEVAGRIDPMGIGPVDHSKYRNRVAVLPLGPRQVLLFGEESSGSYVAMLDPISDKVVSNEIWRE